MIPVQRRMKVPSSPTDDALYQLMCKMRVALPGIVLSFDPGPLWGYPSVSVQPTPREVINQGAVPTPTALPVLDAVPVVYPNGGGWNLTFPIDVGDEVWLAFGDMGLDLWKQNGGLQNQPEGVKFRHDIGDAVAIAGLRSKPRAIANWSTTSTQLRTDDGTVVLDLSEDGIVLNAAESSTTGNLKVASGASGIFTSGDGQTVTVQNGIIIDIE